VAVSTDIESEGAIILAVKPKTNENILKGELRGWNLNREYSYFGETKNEK